MKLFSGKANLKDARSEDDGPGSQGRWGSTVWDCGVVGTLQRPASSVRPVYFTSERADPGLLLLCTLDMPTEVSTPDPRPNRKPGFWKSVDWKLMFALLIPVTLETLDYTGMYAGSSTSGKKTPCVGSAHVFVVVATAQTRIAVSGIVPTVPTRVD